MRLEVLLSCMHQTDASIIQRSNIQTDVLVINQCDEERYEEFSFTNKKGETCLARMFYTKERGLSKSRNMAIKNAQGDICLICDDDECFEDDYEDKIIGAYQALPQFEVITFALINPNKTYPDKSFRVDYIKAMKISSQQISFKRSVILNNKILFDEQMGSGTKNGGGEEIKFLFDNLKRKHKLYYTPLIIAHVAQTSSMWFKGYNKEFVTNLGWSTRRIMGGLLGFMYSIYWPLTHHRLYKSNMSLLNAIKYFWRGFNEKR